MPGLGYDAGSHFFLRIRALFPLSIRNLILQGIGLGAQERADQIVNFANFPQSFCHFALKTIAVSLCASRVFPCRESIARFDPRQLTPATFSEDKKLQQNLIWRISPRVAMRNRSFEGQSSFERWPSHSQFGTEVGGEAYPIFASSGTLTRPARRSAKEKAPQREPGEPDSRPPVQRDNLILAALPTDERKRLEPFLEMVELGQGKDLILPDEPIREVYFPINMVTSTLQQLRNGSSVEVGLMGVEGLVGIQFWLRQRTTPSHTLVQITGRTYRMSSKDFESEVMQTPESPLNGLIAGYIHAFLNMTGQTAACNRLHEVETRLARWLCLVYDRVLETHFDLRHEFLAQMLGVHRPAVTIAAKTLQQAGLIRYSRGHVEILDPVGLSNSACECLGLIEAQFDNMFGKSWREPA